MGRVAELIAALDELDQEARVRVHTYAGVRVHGYNTDLGKHASLVDIVGYSPEVTIGNETLRREW